MLEFLQFIAYGALYIADKLLLLGFLVLIPLLGICALYSIRKTSKELDQKMLKK